MNKITLEQTYQRVHEGADVTEFTRLEAVTKDRLVIDGHSIDMRGAVGVFHTAHDHGYDGGWSFSRDESGDTHLHVLHTVAVAGEDDLPASTLAEFTQFPAYMVHPEGVDEAPQEIATLHHSEVTVEAVRQAHYTDWIARIAAVARIFTLWNHSRLWAQTFETADFVATPSIVALQRYSNFNDRARVIGITCRVVRRWFDRDTTVFNVPSRFTDEAGIEELVSKLEIEFDPERDFYIWFSQHNVRARKRLGDNKKVGLTDSVGVPQELLFSASLEDDWADLMIEFHNVRDGVF